MSNKVKKDDDENDGAEGKDPVKQINGDDGTLRLQIVGELLTSLTVFVES